MNKEKGSILLLTVIAIAFVTVLSTALLSMTSMNVGMKYTDRTVKKNVYAAESGIEEAYAIVGKQVEGILLNAESAMNTQITGIDTQAKDAITKIQAIPRLGDGALDIEAMKSTNVGIAVPLPDPTPTNAYTLYEFYDAYLTPELGLKSDSVQSHIKATYESAFDAQWDKVCDGTYTGTELVEMLKLDPSAGSSYYHFVKPGTEITVAPITTVTEPGIDPLTTVTKHCIPITSYFTADGVARVLEATIEVCKPDGNYPIQLQEKRYVDNPLWQYALVSKETLKAKGSSHTTVTGKVYSQGENTDKVAIGVEGATLSLTGDVITRGDIVTQGTASQLTANNGNIYCRSLMTAAGSNNTEINVNNSFLYTSDDIELNGQAGVVSVTGRYIGFSDGSTDTQNSHDKSSAIVINTSDIGAGSHLTIQKATPAATFAGYIDSSLQAGFNNAGIIVPGTAWIDGAIAGDRYQTGESVSVKGNYVAYSNFFDHTTAKYDKDHIYTKDVLGMAFVDGYRVSPGSSKIAYDVTDKEGYFEAFYQELYKGDPAKYFTFNPGNGITIDEGDYTYTLGTSMTSNAGGDSIHTGKREINDSDMRELIEDIGKNYKHITHYLTYRDKEEELSYGSFGPTDGAIEHYLSALSSQKIIEGNTILYTHAGTNKVTITNGMLDGSDIHYGQGMIIVGGDLEIKGDLTFEGTIVAGGNIILGSGTHTITNDGGTQDSIRELVNKPGNAAYQAQFKNSRSYQSTTTVQAGDEGMTAYRYNDIVQIADWKQH